MRLGGRKRRRKNIGNEVWVQATVSVKTGSSFDYFFQASSLTLTQQAACNNQANQMQLQT